MESDIVHTQLNNNSVEARNTLICYLQYLMDYRRDVPQKEEYIIQELQGLASTRYAKQLRPEDPIYRVLYAAQQLEEADGEHAKNLWSELKNAIYKL